MATCEGASCRPAEAAQQELDRPSRFRLRLPKRFRRLGLAQVLAQVLALERREPTVQVAVLQEAPQQVERQQALCQVERQGEASREVAHPKAELQEAGFQLEPRQPPQQMARQLVELQLAARLQMALALQGVRQQAVGQDPKPVVGLWVAPQSAARQQQELLSQVEEP